MEYVRKGYYFLLDTLQSIVIAVCIFLVMYIFFARPFQVSGESMFPNFHNGEFVLTNIIGLRFQPPHRGDVVVFKAPVDAEKDFIKRVIGTPGDTVTLRDGNVYVNDQKLDESAYLKSDVKTYGGAFLAQDTPITVPMHQYFVMGDNRPYSSDSREWGFVPDSSIIGLSFVVYWPVSNFHTVSNPYAK